MALVGGTSRQAVLEKLFILVHQVVQLAVLRRQGVQLVDVELAELFNVYGPALFVGLVVELGVVFVDFGLFGVVEAVAALSAPVSPSYVPASNTSAVQPSARKLPLPLALTARCLEQALSR